MGDNKPLVIVLSQNFSTGLNIIRSVGAAGYTVDLIASVSTKGASEVAAKSKYVRSAVEVLHKKGRTEASDQALLAELLKYAGKNQCKPVLIPAYDHAITFMDQNRSVLEEHFVMPGIIGGGDGALTDRMDAAFQMTMAQDAGLRVAQEWSFPVDEELVISEDVIFPCVCSFVYESGVVGKKKSICSDPDELVHYFYNRSSKNTAGTVVVREYLDPEMEIDVSGVCMDQDVIIPAVIEKIRMAQYDLGAAQVGKIAPVSEIGDVKDKLEKMLRQLHYVGMFDAKLYVANDEIYFDNIKLRCGKTSYAYSKSGANLPALYVRYVTGETNVANEALNVEYGKTFLYEEGAWKDYAHGYMTETELEYLTASVDYTLLCDYDDPVPGKLFMARMNDMVRRAKWKKVAHRVKSALKKVLVPPLRSCKYFLLGYPQTKKKNQRNRFTEKPRVVVAGRNYCSNLCLARAFGRAGYEVEILRIFQVKPTWKNPLKWIKPDAYSQYVKAYHVCITRRKDKRILDKLKAIADRNRKMLLIPADDLVANVVDDHYNMLSKYYLLPNVDHTQGEINRLMSKAVQKELAEAAGLPIINSCVIATEKGKFEIPESVTYPCFIKPNISKNGLKSRMRRCDSAEELAGYLTEFSAKKDIEMLCQDFVDIGREYSILGVSTKNGAIGPGFFGADEGGHDSRKGVALTGVVVPCEQRQQLIDDILKFIGTLKFDGLFDVDLIETADGKMYFVELNMRFGGSGYAITDSGVNLPGMFADYMTLNKPIDFNCKLENPGKRFISEKIMIEEYSGGFLTWSEMKKKMAAADIHFIMDSEDKRPYRHFRRYYFFATLARILLKLKSRSNAAQ